MEHRSMGNEAVEGGIVNRCTCGWVSRPCFSNSIASIEGQNHRDDEAESDRIARAT